jgi:hypothetical protein
MVWKVDRWWKGEDMVRFVLGKDREGRFAIAWGLSRRHRVIYDEAEVAEVAEVVEVAEVAEEMEVAEDILYLMHIRCWVSIKIRSDSLRRIR